MNKNFILVNKVGIVAFWAAALYNLWVPFPGIWYQVVNVAFVALLIVHHIEALIFVEKNRRSEMSLIWHGFQIFVFGMFHTMGLKKELKKVESQNLAAAS